MQRHERVLEIGAGSGYMAALLAHKAQHVTTLEIDPELARLASDNLQRAWVMNVTRASQADALATACPTTARSTSSCCRARSPRCRARCSAQLKPGGRLTAIVGQLPIMRPCSSRAASDAGHSTRRAVRHRRAAPDRLRRAERASSSDARRSAGPELVDLRRAAARRRGTPLLLLDVREPWEVELAAIRLDGATTRVRSRWAASRTRLDRARSGRSLSSASVITAPAARRSSHSWSAAASARSITSPAASTPGRATVDPDVAALLTATERHIEPQGTACPSRPHAARRSASRRADRAPRGARRRARPRRGARRRAGADRCSSSTRPRTRYDATYLAARALADSAPYRVEQAEALLRPSASLGGSVARGRRPTRRSAAELRQQQPRRSSLNGRQPLFNRANDATDRAGRAVARRRRAPTSTAPSRT